MRGPFILSFTFIALLAFDILIMSKFKDSLVYTPPPPSPSEPEKFPLCPGGNECPLLGFAEYWSLERVELREELSQSKKRIAELEAAVAETEGRLANLENKVMRARQALNVAW